MKALPTGNEGLSRAAQTLGPFGKPESGELECEFLFRPPFGNQTIIQPSLPAQRLTALRPCLTAGLPFRVAIVLKERNRLSTANDI